MPSPPAPPGRKPRPPPPPRRSSMLSLSRASSNRMASPRATVDGRTPIVRLHPCQRRTCGRMPRATANTPSPRHRMTPRPSPLALLAACAVVLASASTVACDRMYYKTMKKFGVEKRDILVKRVRDARKSQEEAKDEFKSALERFRDLVDVEGGKLEEKYETLNRELERAEDKAEQVHDRV